MIFGMFGGEKKRVAELISAARTGDAAKLQALLEKGVDINAQEPESGDTALLAAIDKGQWAAAEFLLKQWPDLALEDANGQSPLYLSVSRGDPALPMVNLLLKAGALVDLGPKQGDNAGATPLHLACATGANLCLEALIAHGASVVMQRPDGSTPLHTAAIGGDQQTVELLCKAGASVAALNADKRTPLHNCGITGNAKVAAALIQQGAAVDVADAEGCTPLMRAVMKNHAEVARVILDYGANPNVVVHSDDTLLYPLFIAAMNGYDDVVRALLDKGVNVTAKVPGSASPLDAAKHNGHEASAKLIAAAIKRQRSAAKAEREEGELLTQLQRAWGEIDGDALKAIAESRQFAKLPAASRLAVLAVNGDLGGVRALLKAGAKPDQSGDANSSEVAAIVAAAMRKGNNEVLVALLEAEANPNVTRKDGATALLIAASNGDVEAVKVLLARGANPNHALPNGQTVLMSSVVNGQSKVLDLLVDAGADINAIFPEGQFGAFALAVDGKKMRIALHLLQRGARPSFGESETLPLAVAEHGSIELLREIDARGGLGLNAFGARAAFVAARNKDPEVLDYLLNQGIDLADGSYLRYTPLILATLANHESLVKKYIDRGDDLSLLDVDGESALSLAIEKNHHRIVHLLRAAGAQTRVYDDLSSQEAMLSASRDGALGTILNLRDEGASINSNDQDGNSPLLLAAQAGWVGVVRSLYHLGADLNHRSLAGQSASNLAKQAGQEAVLKSLMEFGADDALHDLYGINPPDEQEASRKTIDMADALMGRYSHPFKKELPYDHTEVAEELDDDEDEDEQEGGSEAEAHDGDPILDPLTSAKLDKLAEILDEPDLVNQIGEEDRDAIASMLMDWSMRQGYGALVEEDIERLNGLLESLGEDVDAIRPSSKNPISFEESEGFTGVTDKGEDPQDDQLDEDTDLELMPPLFEAVSEGQLAALKKLVKSGEDVHQTLPDGTTLLMTAAENDHNDIVLELIKLGVNVNQRKGDSFTAFLIACFLGHEDVLKTLAKHGADVNAPYEIGSSQGKSGNQTALTVAAARGNVSMCSLLLKLGADIHVVSDSGYTPLMWSLANGSSEDAAEVLLKAGANPDPDAESGIAISTSTTPLILASTNGMTAIVKALLKRNVAVDKTDGDGWTALKRASNEGHEEVVALLLKAGASPNIADREGWTPLINAAGKGHIEICKALLKAGVDVNATGARGRTPLLQAIGARSDRKALDALKELKRMLSGDDDDEDGDDESSLDLVKALLKAGANPNALHDGASLLSEAIANDDEELAKLLKNHGATEADSQANRGAASEDAPESEEGEAFLVAAMQADADTLRDLATKGVDVNYTDRQGRTALGVLLAGLLDESKHRTFRRNAEQCLDYLLRHGANPNLGDPPPFILAAMGRRLHLLQSMLSAGIDVNRSIEEGQTALFLSLLAPHKGQPADDRCALELLNAGADSSLKHESGAMPIHLAAASNYLGALQALLERRPQDIDAKTNIGITPLMMAATEGHAEVVRVLLNFGADCTLQDDEGLTAKDVAIKNRNEDLVPLLS